MFKSQYHSITGHKKFRCKGRREQNFGDIFNIVP